VTATRGFVVHESLVAAFLGLVAAVVLLVPACRTSGPVVGSGGPAVAGTGPGEQAVAVVPLGSIVPLTGGRDIPDAASFPAPARMLLQEADRGLRAGDFNTVAEAAQRARQEAGKADTKTRCIADAVEGIANVNRGDPKTGLQELQQGECAINSVPDGVRPEMATLYHRATGYAYAQSGNEAAAEREFDTAAKLSPDKKSLIVNEFCRVTKQQGTTARCATTPTTSATITPRTTTARTPKPTTTTPTKTMPSTTTPTTTMSSTTTPRTTTPTTTTPTTTTPTTTKPAPSKPTASKPTTGKPRQSASTTPAG
jgi:hypothetical protein